LSKVVFKLFIQAATWSTSVTSTPSLNLIPVSSLRGAFYRLYLILDIFSRKIVAWEVHENESADHASALIRRACLAEGIHQDGLVLHADRAVPQN